MENKNFPGNNRIIGIDVGRTGEASVQVITERKNDGTLKVIDIKKIHKNMW